MLILIKIGMGQPTGSKKLNNMRYIFLLFLTVDNHVDLNEFRRFLHKVSRRSLISREHLEGLL